MDPAGIYDRKFQELYNDGSSRCTTAKKIWENGSAESNGFNEDDININCKCCEYYETWKQRYPVDAQKLKECVQTPVHYRAYPDKIVKVGEDEKDVVYTGTIHSIRCSDSALPHGNHPYQCSFCLI